MQLVLSNSRVVAHGENFLAMGSVVINTETGARYENATVAECENCPSDIGKVGYEYHGGVFKPCAPFGKGNNNGYFMEVCSECAVPRSSGIPILGGIKKKNLDTGDINTAFYTVIWENASLTSSFEPQTITLSDDDYDFLLLEMYTYVSDELITTALIPKNSKTIVSGISGAGTTFYNNFRDIEIGRNSYGIDAKKVSFGSGLRTNLTHSGSSAVNATSNNACCVPIKIYGVKL